MPMDEIEIGNPAEALAAALRERGFRASVMAAPPHGEAGQRVIAFRDGAPFQSVWAAFPQAPKQPNLIAIEAGSRLLYEGDDPAEALAALGAS